MKLPPPAFFNIHALAEYWQCPESTVYQYILSDYLRPAFSLNEVICTYVPRHLIGVEWDSFPFHDQITFGPHPTVGVFTLCGDFPDLLLDSGYSLTATDWQIDVKHFGFTNSLGASVVPQESKYFGRDDILITDYEIARFKRDCCDDVELSEAEKPAEKLVDGDQESDEEIVKRMQQNGLDDLEIVRELARVNPRILPSRIGRLLPANPGASIGPDGPRKRGNRLAESAGVHRESPKHGWIVA